MRGVVGCDGRLPCKMEPKQNMVRKSRVPAKKRIDYLRSTVGMQKFLIALALSIATIGWVRGPAHAGWFIQAGVGVAKDTDHHERAWVMHGGQCVYGWELRCRCDLQSWESDLCHRSRTPTIRVAEHAERAGALSGHVVVLCHERAVRAGDVCQHDRRQHCQRHADSVWVCVYWMCVAAVPRDIRGRSSVAEP